MEQGSVIGIDVGCSSRRPSSAICRLDWCKLTVSWDILRFRAQEPEREFAIRQVVAGRWIEVAAFDGPLRRSFDIIGRYRTAERLLTRKLQPLIGKPGQSSSPLGKSLNLHTNACVQHVLTHSRVQQARHRVPIDEKGIVEAFPTSFLGMMIEEPNKLYAPRPIRLDVFFQHLVEKSRLEALIQHCLPGRKLKQDLGVVSNHDDRAAVVCALTALCVAAGNFVAVGDDDGWIILPPRHFIASEQWMLLNMNASEESGKVIHVETNRRRL